MARSVGAVTVDYSHEGVSVLTALKDLTGGIGPDACIDAVGLESHTGDLTRGIRHGEERAFAGDRPSGCFAPSD